MRYSIWMSSVLHQKQPQVAPEDSIHQTPDLKQRRMKRSQTTFEIDFRNGFELVVVGIMQ